MKKRRRSRGGSSVSSAIIIVVCIALIALGLYWFVKKGRMDQPQNRKTQVEQPVQQSHTEEPQSAEPAASNADVANSNTYTTTTTEVPTFSAPTVTDERIEVSYPSTVANDQIVHHLSYTVSYNDKYEQPDWVFYLLTRAMVNGSEKRGEKFLPDPDVKLATAVTTDYSKSGYDRGHLCPSADVRHDATAQSETFYMSNISPQEPNFNRGVWKKLEELVRQFVLTHDSLYIVTGPVLKDKLKHIGKRNKVAVPEQFYKIIYTPKNGGHMIGFLMPNKGSNKKLSTFIVSVDEIESVTGLDFFSDAPNEADLESKLGNVLWWQQCD
ncbi:MAG: DNA/RNA non-specific endonuclease [Bacteroidales bacterium]|nr:DNA/RNA non-specific endonuclease [Bacteroidales bacterium]